MADADSAGFPHLWVRGRAESRDFHRVGGGDRKIRDVEHRAHGRARRDELNRALREHERRRAEELPTLEELEALGVTLVLEGADAKFPLRIESLERMSTHRVQPKRPLWLLLSVTPAKGDEPEKAMVWVSDEYRARFVKLFEEYLERRSPTGEPWNRELVANLGRIRAAVVRDLWQSAGEPPTSGLHWWELWLRPSPDGVERLRDYAQATGATVSERILRLSDRTVTWMRSSWDHLQALPFTAVPLAEIRKPELVETIEDFPRDEQDELTEDLAQRVEAAGDTAPAVCHLDTGVMRSHLLLAPSLPEDDMHSAVGGDTVGTSNHGTLMAGLALYGPLEELLLGNSDVALRHRLESVKILPDAPRENDALTYGVVTAAATALPEATAPARPRVFCMPVTAEPENPGEPSLWSAAVDALSVGVGVGRSEDGIEVLGAPDPDATRLFVISAGNVGPEDLQSDYLAGCDTAAIEDPAHAWNALTVGAHTELASTPEDPAFDGWAALGAEGNLSPHSRTSLAFATRTWPIKPDICMEGGNILTDGGTSFHEPHPLLCLRTTDTRHDLALGSAYATSAATAQAARLAALAMATYPSYWPETVRGLLTHGAEWTPAMRTEIDSAQGKTRSCRCCAATDGAFRPRTPSSARAVML